MDSLGKHPMPFCCDAQTAYKKGNKFVTIAMRKRPTTTW